MQALLDAILANPDDDDLRMVYADALQSAGDPRGELILLQCRLEREPSPLLHARVRELMTHGRVWLADVLALKLGAQFGFRRGFIDSLTAHFPAATQRAAELVARAPLLSRLELSVHGQLDRMQLAQPKSTVVLERAADLQIRGRHRGNTRDARGPIADLDALAQVAFQRLRTLRLAALRTRPAQLVGLLGALALDSLMLRLRMPAAEVREVVPAIRSLRVLDLTSNVVDLGVFRQLLAQNPGLEELVLDQTQLPGEAIDTLVATAMPALRRLSLAHTGIDTRGARAIAAWTGAPRLASVELRGTIVDPDVIEAMHALRPDVIIPG